MSHFVADDPFEFLIRGRTEYAARQTDSVEAESHGVRACVPVTVNVQLPFHPHFQEQAFQPCRSLASSGLYPSFIRITHTFSGERL